MSAVEHKIRWYVWAGGELIPRESTMRGGWPYEAKCSCGWQTRSGGAVRSFIEREIRDHKFDVEHGFWSEAPPVEGVPEISEAQKQANARSVGLGWK